MELIGLNVLEVEQIKLKKASPAANGVTRDQVVARVKVEGGVLQIPVADMVDIPLSESAFKMTSPCFK